MYKGNMMKTETTDKEKKNDDNKVQTKGEDKGNMYLQLFILFFKLGLFTIGGGMAMVPLLEEKVCNEKGWLDQEEVVDCLAVSQGLPGVIAINMATYVGHKKKGFMGSLVATFGMILPSFLIIIAVVLFLNKIQDNPYVQGGLTGIRAAATGLVAYAAIKLGKKVLKGQGWFTWLLALAAFVAIAILEVSAAWVILAGIVLGIVYYYATGKHNDTVKHKSQETEEKGE